MQTIFAKSDDATNGVADHSQPHNFTTAAPGENGLGNRALVDALTNSRIYRDYERAFSDLTGLPVALQPIET